MRWKSETALKLLWNCSETALKLLWNCSETALKQFLFPNEHNTTSIQSNRLDSVSISTINYSKTDNSTPRFLIFSFQFRDWLHSSGARWIAYRITHFEMDIAAHRAHRRCRCSFSAGCRTHQGVGPGRRAEEAVARQPARACAHHHLPDNRNTTNYLSLLSLTNNQLTHRRLPAGEWALWTTVQIGTPFPVAKKCNNFIH